jgi:putative DNA primase/helicase
MSFRLALEASGLRPRAVEADGKLRRCATDDKPGKRNGWYVLHPDGHGVWGDWATGGSAPTGTWKDARATQLAADPAVQARMRAHRDRERSNRAQAMRSAREFWNRARPLNLPHPYIVRKGLTPLGCAGLRTHDGLLVVPMWHDDWIRSIQTITPTGEKLFWPGAPAEGCAYTLRRERSAVTVLAEGLSTALAVFQSVRTASVVCCFNAGNLLPVVERMKPRGAVVIAADNDWSTALKPHMHGVNPGVKFATAAAESIGAGVAWPEGIEGTDWADALAEWGEGGARRVERLILAKARFVMSP